jgi:hypothetical protein
MVKVYAGVDSIRLSPKTATAGFESDYRETTIKKFGTGSFKPAGNPTTTSGGGLHRQAYNFNQSNRDSTRVFRRTGFFDVTETSEQDNSYAWDCWFYLNSSSSGNVNNFTPSIFSWEGPRSSSGASRSYELRVISDSELRIQLCQGSSTTNISNSINASFLGETDFLNQWFWVAFQKTPSTIGGNPASKYEGWIGTSGSANKILDSNQRLSFVPGFAIDQYRVGATGVGSGSPQFTPIDGYIDEVAVRKGAPFSGTVTCPTSEYTGDEDGMLELYHYSSTSGQLYTNSGKGIDASDNGSSINGPAGPYLKTFNPNATTTDLNNNPGFSIGYSSLQLGNVEAGAFEIVNVTGVSGSTSFGGFLPDNQVVGASLKAFRGGSITNAATLDTTPIPFSGLRSINCGARGSLKGLYLPISQFEYSFYNDFTIECFLRGDGTTNDGGFLSFDVNLGSGQPNKIQFMIEGDELQLNNYQFPGRGYQTKIGVDIGTRTTTDWYHFACVRKDNKYSLFWNGNRVAYDVDSAGNGTADTINIQSNDAYLFKPMGGNNPNNQASLENVLLGFGGNKPSDQSGNFFWGGYIANYRSSYIAQYDPSSSTYSVPGAPFSNFSGTTTYYKDSTNNSLFNESDNLPTTFNDLVLENISLGSVTVSLESTIDVTGQSLSLSYNPATALTSQAIDVTGVSGSTSLGTITDRQGFDVFGSLLQVTEGTVNAQIELPVPVTGQNLTTSLGSASGQIGVFAPVTGQNLTASLNNVLLPTIWSNVTTGITSTWTPVDTGGKAVGP